MAGIQTDLRAHASGDKVVVAGDDLDLDSIVFERCQNLGGVRQWRIGKGQEAGQDQVAFVLHRVVRARWDIDVSHGQRAVSLTIQIVARLADDLDGILANGFDLAISLVSGEERDDPFRSALGDENPL